MKSLYVYSLETGEHVATIKGEDKILESKADDIYGSNDYGWTYSPAFGYGGGLEKNKNAEVMEFIPAYTVKADKETGEWLGEPEFIDYVERSSWNAKTDTDDAHFDTYEHDDQTRAIEVNWVD